MELIDYIDINNKPRKAYSLKTVYQDDKQYVEAIVIGRTKRSWREWYAIEEFQGFNPEMFNDLGIFKPYKVIKVEARKEEKK